MPGLAVAHRVPLPRPHLRASASTLDVGGVGPRAAPRPGRDRRPHLDLGPRRRGCCAAATCSSGRRPTPATPRRCSATPASGPSPCARWSALEPEVLLPGHGFPVVGADRVRQALTDTADLLDSLVDQTLELMNAGARLDEVLHTVAAPAHLARPALPPARLRRARVRGPQRLAPLRRVVGREPGRRSSRPPSRPWPASWPPWPAGPASWPTGPWRCSRPPRRAAATRPVSTAAGGPPGRAGGAGRADRPGRPPGARRGVRPAVRGGHLDHGERGVHLDGPGLRRTGRDSPTEAPRSNYYSRITVG